MIASYSNERFPPLITQGIKIHTIREDKTNRWKVGMKIQHWMYSPRLIHLKGSHPVCTDKDYECKGLQRIFIKRLKKTPFFAVRIGSKKLSLEEMERLAINDGFDSWRQMIVWFMKIHKKKKPKDLIHNVHLSFYRDKWQGKIIHWTDFKY